MERSTSRKLYLSGLALFISGLFPWPIVAGDFGPAPRSENATVLIIVGISALALLVVGATLSVTGYVGALVTLARLSQWAWFAPLLFSALTMFAYNFAGPTESTGNAGQSARSCRGGKRA
jgi:hypothetical protein